MKKIIGLVLVLCMLLPMAVIPAHAASSGTCGANLTWTLDDSGTLTISGTGDMTNYSFSSSAPWYSSRSSIKTVVIGDSVTSIGSSAFSYCSSLTSITIGSGVTSIGDYAFEDCSGLTSITIPDGVTSIGIYAFSYCSGLTSITIGSGVTSIGDKAFYYCESLTSITIPNSVTSIGWETFASCWSLTDLYYSGSEAEWNKINGSYDCFWTNTRIHYKHIPRGSGKTCTVRFDLNDGSGNVTTKTVEIKEYVTPPANPTRNGYIFIGWYSNKQCTGLPYINSYGSGTRAITSDMTLYAGWYYDGSAGMDSQSGFKWGRDTFKFGNYNEFSPVYKISDEYLDLLCQGLGWYDKRCLKSAAHIGKSFEGSCFGMSIVMSMFYQKLMNPGFFVTGASYAHDLPFPENNSTVESMINYYQFSQHLPDFDEDMKNQRNKGHIAVSRSLVQAMQNIGNTKMPVIVNFRYKSVEGGGKKWYYHSVLAFKMDTDEVGYYYRIAIADPNWLRHTNNNGVFIEAAEPKYIYIDPSKPADASYDGYSYNNKTFEFLSILDTNSLYNGINLQNRIKGKSTKSRGIKLFSAEDEEFSAMFKPDFESFTISDGTKSATVTDGEAVGDLDLNTEDAIDFNNNMTCILSEQGDYSITAEDTELEKYVASMNYINQDCMFMQVQSAAAPEMEFYHTGKVCAATAESAEKTVSLSSKEDYSGICGVSVTTELPQISLWKVDSGNYALSTDNGSLLGCTVKISDYDCNETAIVIDKDSLSCNILINESGEYCIEYPDSIDLYQRTFSAAFYTMGGSSVDTVSDIPYGALITAPEEPTKAGYTFDGWFKDAEYTEAWNFDTDTMTDNTILYARWYEDPDYYHIVLFDDGTVQSQIIVTDGGSIAEEDYPEITEQEGIKSHWENVDLSNITEDITVGIVSEEIGKVDVNAITEGNGNVSGGGTFYKGEYAKVTAIPMENEEFLGWYDGETLISSDAEYRFAVTEDIELTAKFTENTCEVLVVDGNEFAASIRIIKGGSFSILDIPERSGYRVFGYFTDEEMTVPFDENEIINSDLTLYGNYVKESELVQASVDTICENNQVVANVVFDCIFDNCCVIFGIYDDENRLITLTSNEAKEEDKDISLYVPADESCIGYSTKVFFWNDLISMKPIGQSVWGEIRSSVLESANP